MEKMRRIRGKSHDKAQFDRIYLAAMATGCAFLMVLNQLARCLGEHDFGERGYE